jgi:hypothetical protein
MIPIYSKVIMPNSNKVDMPLNNHDHKINRHLRQMFNNLRTFCISFITFYVFSVDK